MNRDYLKSLGLDDDTIESIMSEHGKAVNSEKEKTNNKDQELKNVQSERDTLKNQIGERDQQLETLKKQSGDNEGLQNEIERLKQENKDAKDKYEKQLQDQKFNYEINQQLIQSNARDTTAARALLDTDTMKFDEQGNLQGLSEQIDKLQQDKAFLFDIEDPADGDPEDGDPEGGDPEEQGGQPAGGRSNYRPGPKQKQNNPKNVPDYNRGKERAMQRYGINKGD